MINKLLQVLSGEYRPDVEVEAFLVVEDRSYSIPITGLAECEGKLILFGDITVAQKAMSSLFLNVIEEANKYGELRDLLVKGDENKRPKMKINNKEYVLGLVDEKPMLVSTDNKHEFLDPEMVAGSINGLSWDLQPSP